MAVKVQEYDTIASCFHRRQKLCLGYSVSYDQDTNKYTVNIFAVKHDHTDAPLGTLTMKHAEWLVFHALVYQQWENLDYPKLKDEEYNGAE